MIELWVTLTAVVVISVVIISYLVEKKRQEALVALASRLGLRYRKGKDRGLVLLHGAFDLLRKGSNRYAQCILSGDYEGEQVTAFDFHYETYSTNSKGQRQTHHHYFTCVICALSRPYPEMKVRPEGLFDKVAAAVGWDDIDFESYDFSKRYHVSSRDKKFAYDFFHTRMMQYFLDHPGLVLEIDGPAMLFSTEGRIDPDRLETHLDRLVAIRELIPRYLSEGASS